MFNNSTQHLSAMTTSISSIVRAQRQPILQHTLVQPCFWAHPALFRTWDTKLEGSTLCLTQLDSYTASGSVLIASVRETPALYQYVYTHAYIHIVCTIGWKISLSKNISGCSIAIIIIIVIISKDTPNLCVQEVEVML